MLIGFKHRDADPDLNNLLIRLWTGSPWTHCELFFESRGNVAISATTEQDGVIMRTYEQVVTQPQYWEFYRVPVNDENEVIDYLLSQINSEFNFGGIALSQVLNRPSMLTGRWFCSELCYSALQRYALYPLPYQNPAMLSPAELRTMVQQYSTERVNI